MSTVYWLSLRQGLVRRGGTANILELAVNENNNKTQFPYVLLKWRRMGESEKENVVIDDVLFDVTT